MSGGGKSIHKARFEIRTSTVNVSSIPVVSKASQIVINFRFPPKFASTYPA